MELNWVDAETFSQFNITIYHWSFQVGCAWCASSFCSGSMEVRCVYEELLAFHEGCRWDRLYSFNGKKYLSTKFYIGHTMGVISGGYIYIGEMPWAMFCVKHYTYVHFYICGSIELHECMSKLDENVPCGNCNDKTSMQCIVCVLADRWDFPLSNEEK